MGIFVTGITAGADPRAGETVEFDITTQPEAVGPGDVRIDFGDGSPAADVGNSTGHTYSTPGEYTVEALGVGQRDKVSVVIRVS